MQNNSQARYEVAALDRYAERITNAIATVGGILMLPTLFWYLSGMINYSIAVPGIVISAAIGVALAAWLALNYAVLPRNYEIRDDTLFIQRRWARAIKLPLKDILGVSTAPALADVPRRGLRQAFNAGVFGYHGPFQLVDYGKVFFAATNRERLVAIARRGNMPLIISPQRPRDFTETLREVLLRKPEEEQEEQESIEALKH